MRRADTFTHTKNPTIATAIPIGQASSIVRVQTAEKAMLIDFASPIRDLDGKPLVEGDKTITLAIVAVNALLAPHADAHGQPERITGAEKIERFELATRIHGAHLPVEVSVEDAAKIKSLVDRAYPSPLIFAQVARAIEAPKVA